MLLSDLVPLRSSAVIAAYRESAWLPWVYGDLSNSPQLLIQLTDTRFLYADHDATVTGVQIDDQDVQGFGWQVTTDDSGHTITVVDLTAPLPIGAKITATGTGKRHPRTAALMENPADILDDILSRAGYVAGTSLTASLIGLRSRCGAEGLAIGGTVRAQPTLRATINEIVRSIGGGWSSGSIWLHPSEDALTVPYPLRMAQRLPDAVVTSCTESRGNSFSVVAMKFDDRSGTVGFAQSLTLAARPSLAVVDTPFEINAPWLRTPAAATTVCERLLRRLTGATYTVEIESPQVSPPVQIGEVVPVESARIPADEAPLPATVIAMERLSERLRITAEIVVPLPVLQFAVVSRTVAGSATQQAGIEAAFSNGTATFTITDAGGKALVGARVSLDGATPKQTDAKGKVTFQAAKGLHKLYVEASGYQPFQMTVTL